MDLDDAGPDRNRLYDLVKLKWDEAQSSGTRAESVSDEQIAEGGPYSVEQIREHLLAEEHDRYVVKRQDDGTVHVLSVQ